MVYGINFYDLYFHVSFFITRSNTHNIEEYARKLQKEPEPSVLAELVVDSGGVPVVDVAGDEGGEGAGDEERHHSHEYLMTLQFWGEPLVRLDLPLSGPVTPVHVEVPLESDGAVSRTNLS